ncbi:hypothetical protein HYT17_00605 [Candidatus Microgenomates bacterium]|nr:hypothetical protein [Candidatus Microgenomates bacterium]
MATLETREGGNSPIKSIDPRPFFPPRIRDDMRSEPPPSLTDEGLRRVLDVELRNKILGFRASGLTQRGIGQELGMTPRRVSLAMTRLGIPKVWSKGDVPQKAT